MLPDGSPKDDVKVPDSQIGQDIEAAFDAGKEVTVTIIAAMGMLNCFYACNCGSN
jgi:translation initiation factor 5A